MLPVIVFLAVIITAYVIINYFNEQRKEKKGICKTTGGSCTSPTGCTCGADIEEKQS
jgi:hypothetical protein